MIHLFVIRRERLATVLCRVFLSKHGRALGDSKPFLGGRTIGRRSYEVHSFRPQFPI